jgi:neutral amino acid transport system permease protein
MAAGSASAEAPRVEHRASLGDRLLEPLSRNPGRTAAGIVVAILLVLIIAYGLQPTAQRSLNGLVSGSYFALGAIGLSLVYGTLKLVNFAHGDMLTFGAYIAFLVNVTLGAPILIAVLGAVVVTAALGIGFERAMWRPMRAKKAGLLQLLLMAIGLAFVIRNGIQVAWGTEPRSLRVDVTGSVNFLGLRIGETELVVVIVGLSLLVAIGLMLRFTALGKQMRALADDFDLAEVTGIDTDRIVLATWVVAAGTVGLAGVLVAMSLGSFTPNIGFFLLLSLFAAVILGGIGNAYGALAGGLMIGLAQEWSTLMLDARWKVLVGFGVLILVLVVRPQGIFGKERTL